MTYSDWTLVSALGDVKEVGKIEKTVQRRQCLLGFGHMHVHVKCYWSLIKLKKFNEKISLF